MWLQGRLKYVATTNSDQLALVNAYNGWMHSQFTKAYADSHCLHMASLLMIKGSCVYMSTNDYVDYL